jgi:hypothetical protein
VGSAAGFAGGGVVPRVRRSIVPRTRWRNDRGAAGALRDGADQDGDGG